MKPLLDLLPPPPASFPRSQGAEKSTVTYVTGSGRATLPSLYSLLSPNFTNLTCQQHPRIETFLGPALTALTETLQIKLTPPDRTPETTHGKTVTTSYRRNFKT